MAEQKIQFTKPLVLQLVVAMGLKFVVSPFAMWLACVVWFVCKHIFVCTWSRALACTAPPPATLHPCTFRTVPLNVFACVHIDTIHRDTLRWRYASTTQPSPL